MWKTALCLTVFYFVGGHCQTEDCKGVQCRPEEFCNGNEICEAKKELDETCNGVGQCKLATAECTGNEGSMTCQCITDWTEGPEKSCIPTCPAGGCGIWKFCSKKWNGCLFQVNFKQNCAPEENEDQCRTENAKCDESIDPPLCLCDPDTSLEKDGACLLKCTADSSLCNEHTEYCDASSGKCMSKKMLGEECSNSDQCAVGNSTCSTETNLCDCVGEFVNYYNSACKQRCTDNAPPCMDHEYCVKDKFYCVDKVGLEGPCDSNSEGQCKTDNAVCKDDICQCNDEHERVGDICLKKCTDHLDCNNQTVEYCDLETTPRICKLKFVVGEPCSESYECREGEPKTEDQATCSDGFCSCEQGFIQFGTSCQKMCAGSQDCVETDYCDSGTGRCQPKVELNGKCNEDNECKDPSSSCNPDSKLCECNADNVDDGGICVMKCGQGNACSVDKFCSGSGKCEVKVGWNQPCWDDVELNQCIDSNAECTNEDGQRFCLCKQTYVQHSGKCVEICSDVSNCQNSEYCDSDFEKPICQDRVGLGAECKTENVNQCTENTICDSERCRCDDDHYQVEGTQHCALKCTKVNNCNGYEFCNNDDGRCEFKKGLGEVCSANEQCKTSNSECNTEKKCACPISHFEENKECKEKCTDTTVCDHSSQFCDEGNHKCYAKIPLNATCLLESQSKECLDPLSECQRIQGEQYSQCFCSSIAVLSSSLDRCLKKAAKLNEPCQELAQCKYIGDGNTGAICEANKCKCSGRTTANSAKDKCLKIADQLNENCEEHQQCTEGIGGDAECADDKKCRCKNGFYGAEDGKKCEKNKSAGSSLSLISLSWIVLIAMSALVTVNP